MGLRETIGFALVLLVAPAGAVFSQAPAPGGRAVAGTVVDTEARATIGGVHVRLLARSADVRPAQPDAGLPVRRETLSGADGRFRLLAVPAGRYRLVIELDGFQPFEYPGDVVVTGDADPPALLVSYPLRMTAEVQARAEAIVPDEPAAGSTMTTVAGRAVVVAPGALEDVMRAFQMRPGVAASQDDRNDMLVRGGGAIENATRVDGFDIPNPSHFGAQGGSGGGFSFIAPWLIDRAVLRAGGFPVEFGERASSVLDLTLKGGAKDRLRGQVGASVGGAMGQAEGPLNGQRGSWLASARRSFLDLVLVRGGDTAIPHYSDVIGRVEYALSPVHRIELLALGAVDDVVVNPNKPTDSLEDNQASALVGVSLHSQWSPATVSDLYVSYTRASIDGVMHGKSVDQGTDRSKEVELRARGELSRRVGGDGRAMVGLAMKQAHLRFDLAAKSFVTEYNLVREPVNAHFPYAFTDLAGYAELRLPTFARLQLTPGIRIDRKGTTDRLYASPRVNVAFRASERVRLTGAAGVYRQDIPYIWIGSDVRNASLDPVRSVQVLAGVSTRLPGLGELIVEGFDKRYSGYVVDPLEWWHVLVDAAADFESPFVGRLQADGTLHARGIDTSIGRRLHDRVVMNASYSWWRVTQSTRTWPPVFGSGRPGDYDIRNQVRLEIAYDKLGTWRAGAQFRYASGRPYTPYDVRYSIAKGSGRYSIASFNGSSYPPYHRLDVRLDRTFAIGRTSLVVYGELENVYNRDNVLVYEWNKASRQARPVYQWGRLPIAGIRWEF